MSDQYKPSDHDGLRKDGQPDERMQQDSFAYGKVDPHEAGKQGGHTSGSGTDTSTSTGGNDGTDDGQYKPSEHDGLRKDGQPDERMQQDSFAYGKVDPHEAGKMGGHASSGGTDGTDDSGNTGSTGNSGGSAKGEFAHGKVDPHEAGRKGGMSS
ncbi:hypothetical protein PMZ80_002940 [Knufia obscura]|uniref:Uncharacterized protein n=2 Tax=Knufia TaxID=430999 RepID=A0AAN8ED06_9EURO|nr:hypothetical protein PMZ80_002940 [Knufia obscura]KAK5952473.1 hypothetical protein OHC33_006516 [Knufia fluminis]